MNKKGAILLAFIMVLSLAGTAFAQPPELSDMPGPRQSLVALGDSITAGRGLEKNLNMVSRKAYPQLLGDEIDYRVTNLAVSGMTSGEILDEVKNNSRYRNAIARADMIILNTGGADMLGFLYGVLEGYIVPTPEAVDEFITGFGTNLYSVLAEIEMLNAGAPVLLFDIYEPYPLALILEPEEYGRLMPLLFGVNQTIAGFEGADHIYLVNAYAAFDEYPGEVTEKAFLLFVDEVHLNEKGQLLLYNAAYEVVDTEGLQYSRPVPPGLAKKAAAAQ